VCIYGFTKLTILLTTILNQDSYDRWFCLHRGGIRYRVILWQITVIDSGIVIGNIDRHVMGIFSVRDVEAPIRATD